MFTDGELMFVKCITFAICIFICIIMSERDL